jgi:hypothetical protein
MDGSPPAWTIQSDGTVVEKPVAVSEREWAAKAAGKPSEEG